MSSNVVPSSSRRWWVTVAAVVVAMAVAVVTVVVAGGHRPQARSRHTPAHAAPFIPAPLTQSGAGRAGGADADHGVGQQVQRRPGGVVLAAAVPSQRHCSWSDVGACFRSLARRSQRGAQAFLAAYTPSRGCRISDLIPCARMVARDSGRARGIASRQVSMPSGRLAV